MIAFAIQPSIVSPTHYFGQSGYISDTEKTQILNAKLFEMAANQQLINNIVQPIENTSIIKENELSQTSFDEKVRIEL